MNFYLTSNVGAAQSSLTRLQAGSFNWPHSEDRLFGKTRWQDWQHAEPRFQQGNGERGIMNLEVELLKLLPHLFNALDALIKNYGVYLYLVSVWLALATIAWIISGGLRRGTKGNSAIVIPCIIVMTPPPRRSAPPTIDIEVEQMGNDSGGIAHEP